MRFGADVAPGYDADSALVYDPAVLAPAVDVLAELAGPHGRALELGVGTGRVAIPLGERGIEVHGIDESQPMLDVLLAKTTRIPVTCGDMTTTRVHARLDLVYVVYNTITNLETQDAQVACFENAAAHLRPGGRLVVECVLPRHRGTVFLRTDDRVSFEDVDPSRATSRSHHHWFAADGRHQQFSGAYRDVHPAELDLMARIAGLRLEHRWADWHRAPLTRRSTSAVSVWVKVETTPCPRRSPPPPASRRTPSSTSSAPATTTCC